MKKEKEMVSLELTKLVDAVIDEFVDPIYSTKWKYMDAEKKLEWCKEFARNHAVWTYSDGEPCEEQPVERKNQEKHRYSRDCFDNRLDKLDTIIEDYRLVEETRKEVLSGKDHRSKLVVGTAEPLASTTINLDTEMLSELLGSVERQYIDKATTLCCDMRDMIDDLLDRRLSS